MSCLLSFLFPAEVVEFFFGSYKFYCAVVEQDAAAPGVVVVEGEKLRSAVLVPAGLGLE